MSMMWTSSKIFLAFLLSFLLNGSALGRNDFEMTFDNCTCIIVGDRSIVPVLQCGLSKSTKRRTFNIDLQFSRDISKWMLNMKITLPRNPNDFLLLNLTNVDGCKLLGNKNQATLLQLGRDNLERYSNIPRQCPFLKDKPYYIKGFRFDLSLLPAFNFESELHIVFEFLYEKKKLFVGYIQNRIIMKKGKL